MVWRITAIAIVALVAAFALTGCCPWLGEQAAEEAVEQGTGGQVDIDEGGDSVTIETEEGSAKIQGGDSAEVPSGFPSTMPVYDGPLTMSSAIETEDGTLYSLGIETDDAASDVSDWYKDELEAEGWTILAQVSNDSGSGMTYAYTVEGADGQGQIYIGEEEGKTVVSLNVTSEK